MGKLLRGLAQGGFWVCLDEFNRVDIEVRRAALTQLSDTLTILTSSLFARKGRALCFKCNGGFHWFRRRFPSWSLRRIMCAHQVLSVIAQQLLVLREGRLMAKPEINFMGVQIALKDHHVIITMNPGYAGRTELPDNLAVRFLEARG